MIEIVFGMALPWGLVLLGCWLLYQLIQQNGRILIRLEQLEGRLAGALAAGGSAPTPQGLTPGTPAPDFELPDLEGDTHRLADWRGQPVLLVFFNPECGFCERMAADLAALPTHGEDGRPIPLVVTSGDLLVNRRFMDEHAVRCPVLVQSRGEASSRYQASGTPMGYLIDADGTIAAPLAVGAEALLALAAIHVPTAPEPSSVAPAAAGPEDSRPRGKANRGLHTSRLKRDGLKAGTPAPLFRLPRLDGGELALEDYRGQRVLLIFSDPECGPCMELAPRLEQFHRAHPAVPLLLISRRDAEANRKKTAELGLTFPVLLQKHWEVSLLYGMFATPIGYLIDRHGVLASDVAIGARPIEELLERAARPEPAADLQENGTAVEPASR